MPQVRGVWQQRESTAQNGFRSRFITHLPFDIGQYMEHFIGYYFSKRGREVRYEACMADLDDCEWIPTPPPCEDDDTTPGCG